MTRSLLIASAVALALSVTACGRNDERADANRTAPGANTATSPSYAIPPAPDQSATGGTSGMGAGGTASSPSADTASQSSESKPGMGAGATSDSAAQPYGSQSSSAPSGTPSSDAGSTSR